MHSDSFFRPRGYHDMHDAILQILEDDNVDDPMIIIIISSIIIATMSNFSTTTLNPNCLIPQ